MVTILEFFFYACMQWPERRRQLRDISKPSVSLQALTAEVARSSAVDESTSPSLRRWVAWMNVSSNLYWLGHGDQLRGVDGADGRTAADGFRFSPTNGGSAVTTRRECNAAKPKGV